MGAFYSMSWGLTHLLFFEPQFQGKLKVFLGALEFGSSSEEAIQSTYGVTLKQLQEAFRAHFSKHLFTATFVDAKMEKSAEEVKLIPNSEMSAEILLTDLWSRIHYQDNEAASRYTELTQRYPDQPEIWEGLGYLHLSAARQRGRSYRDFGQSHPVGARGCGFTYTVGIASSAEKAVHESSYLPCSCKKDRLCAGI